MERMIMKLCFNEATTLENSNLVKDLEYCNKHGYDYIEIRTMDKLPEYLESHSMDDLAQFFNENHIKPLALNALVFFNNRSEKEYRSKDRCSLYCSRSFSNGTKNSKSRD